MSGDRFVETWVDARLATLDPCHKKGEEIMTDPARILTSVHAREQAYRKARTRVIGACIFAGFTCGALATVFTISKETRMAESLPPLVAPHIDSSMPDLARPAVIAKQQEPPRHPSQTNVRDEVVIRSPNFKEVGSPSAPVALEIYLDPECPPCATFYRETVPALLSEYVEPGKIRILYRDFPLPQHKYATLAARYANAAGVIGKYEIVAAQIMKTRQIWHESGDVESQVAAVLSPEEMERLREVLETSAAPDEAIARDRAAAADDHVQQTPSIVLVRDGHRRKLNGGLSIEALRISLDEVLGK